MIGQQDSDEFFGYKFEMLLQGIDKYLCNKDFDINVPRSVTDRTSQTHYEAPLNRIFSNASEGHMEVAKLLLESNAIGWTERLDVNSKYDLHGRSPLQVSMCRR